jgi:hypothetical protein
MIYLLLCLMNKLVSLCETYVSYCAYVVKKGLKWMKAKNRLAKLNIILE